MEMLDLIESYQAQDASAERLYAREGRAVRGGRNSTKYKQSLLEAGRFYQGVLDGRVPMWRFSEAMSTSDFTYLFADILDRQLLGRYQEWPVMWRQLARMGNVRDFRTVKRFTVDGGEATLDPVKEASEYKAAALKDGDYEYKVGKFGRRLPITWETYINDDLDALRNLPDRLATAARRSEERFATALFAQSSGPNSTFFTSGHKNLVTGNPTLSVSGLSTALTALSSQVDDDGNPIYVDAVNLVVPPSLEIVANNILNATEILAADGGGTGTGQDQLRVNNWLRHRVKPVVNPWLPIVDTTRGSTAWYLFAAPTVGRPAMEIGFLRGHETPELFVKSPNASRVGGGAASAEDGDFDTDSVDYKVRHVFGGTLMDPKSACASTGAGT